MTWLRRFQIEKLTQGTLFLVCPLSTPLRLSSSYFHYGNKLEAETNLDRGELPTSAASSGC